MARYFSNIDLVQNELQNAVVHLVASDGAVATPVEGQIIYDLSDKLIKYFDGAIWVAINDLEIIVAGDSGSTTLFAGEGVTFAGGTNITSVVTSDDLITFDLDSTISLSNINVDNVYAHDIVSTDALIQTGNIFNVVASDIEVNEIYGGTGSIGTVIFNENNTVITSGLTVSSDLTVNGSISGAITASDVTGVLFHIDTPDDSGDFSVSRGDTVTFRGTSNEIEVSSTEDNVQIGIVTNPTLSGNVIITGDLTVNGSTTTVDSQTLLVKDPVLLFNEGASGASTNVNDIGFVGERGSSEDNIAFFWDEDTDRFIAGFTTASGSDIEVLPITGYVDFTAADVTIASDATIGGKIVSYNGSTPSQGDILVGGASGYSNGTFTVTTNTGLAVTRTDTNVNVAVNIDAATDGSGVTIDGADRLLLSDGGVEKRVRADQLESLFVLHSTDQVLTSDEQKTARKNTSSVEIVTGSFTGTGAPNQTWYIQHDLGNIDVLVQIFDDSGQMVFADVNTDVTNGSGNYVSVSGNFELNVVYLVRVMGTRGSAVSASSVGLIAP